MGQRGGPGEPEGLHHEQARVLPDLRGVGRPGLPAHSRAVPEQDQETKGQFSAVPRREKVGSAACDASDRAIKFR